MNEVRHRRQAASERWEAACAKALGKGRAQAFQEDPGGPCGWTDGRGGRSMGKSSESGRGRGVAVRLENSLGSRATPGPRLSRGQLSRAVWAMLVAIVRPSLCLVMQCMAWGLPSPSAASQAHTCAHLQPQHLPGSAGTSPGRASPNRAERRQSSLGCVRLGCDPAGPHRLCDMGQVTRALICKENLLSCGAWNRIQDLHTELPPQPQFNLFLFCNRVLISC